MTTEEQAFIEAFNFIRKDVWNTADASGWEYERNVLEDIADQHSLALGKYARSIVAASMVALEHAELSEGLEAIRKPQKDDHIPEFTMEEAEAADAIIRIMNRSARRYLRVAEALVAKINYNRTRPYKHGNKTI